MFLLLNIEDFLSEILEASYKEDLYEKISEVTGRSKRQASEYMRKKTFPAGSFFKIKSWLSSEGFTALEEVLPAGTENAVGWLAFVSSFQKHSPDFLPATIQKICGYAVKDIEFLKKLQGLDRDSRFEKYKSYLIHQVIPEYCTDCEQVSAQIAEKNDFSEIRDILVGIFIESTLSILAHAEAEYLSRFCTSQDSILSKCIPEAGTSDADGPSVIFFKLWIEALTLDRKEVVREMLDHFGEAEVTDQDNGLDSLSKDAVEKQIQRYLNEGKLPSWDMVEKWSHGLYCRAVEIQERTEGHQSYSQLTMDIYGGVRVLDKVYTEGRKTLPVKNLDLMASYPIRYKAHLTTLREGAGR